MKLNKKQSIIEFLFIPHYDELSLFIMGYICLLLILFNTSISGWKLINLSFKSEDFKIALLIFIPLIIGMCLCLYHAFTDRPKYIIEKKLMILFAAIINGFSGLWYGTYLLVHRSGWGLSLFPIWNIVSGFILISSIRVPNIEELTISDENVSLSKLIGATLVITLIFLICHIGFRLIWAATFSICVAWTTNISRPVNLLITKQIIKTPRT